MAGASLEPPPSGASVLPHCVVRFGIPPSESNPAIFQLALTSRSGGNKAAAGTTVTVRSADGPVLAETAVASMVVAAASANRRCLIKVAQRSISPLQQNFISRSPPPDCRVIPGVVV